MIGSLTALVLLALPAVGPLASGDGSLAPAPAPPAGVTAPELADATVPALEGAPAPASGDETAPALADALALAKNGDHGRAIELLRRIVAADETNGAAWHQLGLSLHVLGRFEEALPAHARSAEHAVFAASGRYNAACALARLGRADEAFLELAAAIDAGFSDRGLLAGDPDLAKLRADPRFAALRIPLLEGSEAFAERPRVLYTLVGEAGGELFGWVTRAIGDVDGDGALDFASTAPGHAQGAGRVDAFSGRSGERLFTRSGEPGERLGSSVAGGADVDGDGTSDLVAGAPGGERALVLSGRDGSVLLSLPAPAPGGFGSSVCLVEDLDGDERAEVAVGAPRAQGRGAVTIFSGKSGAARIALAGDAAGDAFGSGLDATLAGGHRLLAVGAQGARRCAVLRLADERAEPAFEIVGEDPQGNLGQYFVTFLGDVDLDGVPDLYASDFRAARGAGRVYVHSGRTGERLLALEGEAPGEALGTTAAVCGDANGDGRADLVLGAWQSARGGPSAGRCALHSGKDGAELASWTGLQPGDTLGFDAIGLGDVDGDGRPDFVLSAASSAVEAPGQGRVFVVSLPE